MISRDVSERCIRPGSAKSSKLVELPPIPAGLRVVDVLISRQLRATD
jgi:hypothetical protein